VCVCACVSLMRIKIAQMTLAICRFTPNAQCSSTPELVSPKLAFHSSEHRTPHSYLGWSCACEMHLMQKISPQCHVSRIRHESGACTIQLSSTFGLSSIPQVSRPWIFVLVSRPLLSCTHWQVHKVMWLYLTLACVPSVHVLDWDGHLMCVDIS